jgi:hypothetical protein
MQVRKTQTVELIINGVSGGNTQTVFNFVPQPYLQGKCMSSLEVFSPTEVPFAPSGNALLPVANMNNLFISFYFFNPDPIGYQTVNGVLQPVYDTTGGPFIQNRPIWTFHRLFNSGNDPATYMPAEMAGQVVFWEKSTCAFASGHPPANTITYSLLLDVGYYDPQPGSS